MKRLGINECLGWTLVLAGLLLAAVLDPWLLAVRAVAAQTSGLADAVRHVQAVVIAMGLLQLVVSSIAATVATQRPTSDSPPPAAIGGWFSTVPRGCWLTAFGAATYVAGYAGGLGTPVLLWLVPLGALVQCGGLIRLIGVIGRDAAPDNSTSVRSMIAVLILFSIAMILDAAMGLFAAAPDWFRPLYLGPDDAVRMRMLRLARVAAIALPTLLWLFELRFESAADPPWAVRWGRRLLLAGAAGMPTLLVLAAATRLEWKYLLGLPADATVAGIGLALWSGRSAAGRFLERFGWSCVAVSMLAGLAMGTYAFDGPLPAPAALADYAIQARRLTRVGHAYLIVNGLLALRLAVIPPTAHSPPARRLRTIGTAALVTGTGAGFLTMLAVGAWDLPVGWVAAGPLLAIGGIGLHLVSSAQRAGETSPSSGKSHWESK